MGMGINTGWGLGEGLAMGFFWIALIVPPVFGIRWIMYDTPGMSSKHALDTLKRRDAPGDIDREDFEQRKCDFLKK